jgi:hypothetical protein
MESREISRLKEWNEHKPAKCDVLSNHRAKRIEGFVAPQKMKYHGQTPSDIYLGNCVRHNSHVRNYMRDAGPIEK